MPQRYTTTRVVAFRETDAAGIVHFTRYFGWMEEIEHEYMRHLGFSVVWDDQDGTISWPRVHASCDYTSALKFEDIVASEIEVEKLGDSSVTFHIWFRSQDRAVAEGRIVAVCCRVGQNDRPRSIPIPPWMFEKLRAAMNG